MRRLVIALTSIATLSACARPSPSPAPPPDALPSSSPSASESQRPPDASPGQTEQANKPTTIDPDGDDDPVDTGQGARPKTGKFERVGRPPMAHKRLCDLTPFAGALYAAHANDPLGTDGATITKYTPQSPDPKKAFSVAFDWNRPGEPVEGGGAGQGFTRVHAIAGRLFVPDSDPPYAGFGIADPGTEGYVFVSDGEGKFAPAKPGGHRPPGAPKPDGDAGAAVLPRAYHVLDAIRFRSRFYASTGSVPPKARAWQGPSPGALHVAGPDLSRWIYEVDYPFPYASGVWRLTYMVRFKDRLYAGIQDYDGREPNDFVYFAPSPESTAIAREDTHPVRVTDRGATHTVRWYADQGKLYWIGAGRDGVRLRVTSDGDTWQSLDIPSAWGRPTDITRFRDGLVVLTERRLLSLDGDTFAEIATIDDKKSPFELNNVFCAAPLAVFGNALYAGGQQDGALYVLGEAN